MKKNCVLLVEDSEDDQFLGKRMLHRVLGDVEVIVAHDGLEAIELLRDQRCQPHAILLDINMPRMDGMQFLENYASGNPTVPPVVAMLTSSEQESDKTKSLSYDCVHDYFVKPLQKQDILSLGTFFQIREPDE